MDQLRTIDQAAATTEKVDLESLPPQARQGVPGDAELPHEGTYRVQGIGADFTSAL